MSAKPELKHVEVARSYVGTKEIKGAKHEPKIIQLIKDAEKATSQNLSWLFGKKPDGTTNYEDETAWCGSFIGGVMAQAGLGSKVPKAFYQAKAWNTVGTKLNKAAYGCLVIFNRASGGHVGIVVGKTSAGRLKVLGGNQSDAVNIMDFDTSRVVGYRWVSTGTLPNEHRYDLPVLPAGTVSINEA